VNIGGLLGQVDRDVHLETHSILAFSYAVDRADGLAKPKWQFRILRCQTRVMSLVGLIGSEYWRVARSGRSGHTSRNQTQFRRFLRLWTELMD
jgi:hypothetical protein